MRPFWLVYIHVKDVAKAMDTATKGGAFVQRPRMDIPGGTIAILGDPQGAGFALHDLTTADMTGTTAEKTPSRAKARSTARTGAARKATAKKAATKKAGKKTTKKTAKRTTATARRRPAKKSVKRSAKRRR